MTESDAEKSEPFLVSHILRAFFAADQSRLIVVLENESGEPLSIALDPDAARDLVRAIGQSFPRPSAVPDRRRPN
ncbi:hypothetical protein [Chelativorans sp.]|uniref:hypothetical protein n=1 Tax=Chelativorans sp. TaxID=2203393 RepID=UPI002810CF46|nr:hypothetical protein [Chelativorans sp.]